MHLLTVGHQIAGRHLLELTEEDLEKNGNIVSIYRSYSFLPSTATIYTS